MQILAPEDKKLYQKENNELLKTLLDNRFFSVWRDYDSLLADPRTQQIDIDKNLFDSAMLELYLTAECNQKCTYCYLQQFKDKLYPPSCNTDFEKILHNLNIIIDWCIENKFHIQTIDIFTGEILHTKFGLEVLKVMLDGVDKGWHIDSILWATNASFILNEEQTWRIQNFIDSFSQRNVRLMLSISVDGQPMEEYSRPLNSKVIKDDTYYDNLFIFCKRNDYKFHPMVSAFNVKWWKENYDWWKEMCAKYQLGTFLQNVMALEVRNNDWTEEAIQQYNDLMDYMIDDYLKTNSVLNTAYTIIGDCRGFDSEAASGYVPWVMTDAADFTPCTLNHTLTIRVGDLTIPPCHRTAYQHLLYGKFILENDKIVDIEAINPAMAIKVLLTNYKQGTHGCDTCIYNEFCLRGCLGSQQENVGDPWFPIPGVCHFQQAKYSHLLKKYDEVGIIDVYKNMSPYEIGYPDAAKILSLYQKVGVIQDVGKCCGNVSK